MNGQSAPHTPPPPPAPPAGSFFDSVRRLGIWRSQDRWAGGVAAGIAHRYGLDPLLVRGIFVVVSLFGGLGLVLYGVAWALLPEASDGRIHLEQAVRGHFDIALAGAVAVLIVGMSRPVFWWSASWWAVPWVLVVGIVVAFVLLSRDRDGSRPAPGTPPPHGGPSAPPHGGGPTPPPGGGLPPYGGGPTPPAPTGPVPPAPAGAAAAPGTDLTAPTAAAGRPAYDVQEDALPRTTDTTAALPAAHPDTGATAALPAADADRTTALPAGGGDSGATATLPGSEDDADATTTLSATDTDTDTTVLAGTEGDADPTTTLPATDTDTDTTVLAGTGHGTDTTAVTGRSADTDDAAPTTGAAYATAALAATDATGPGATVTASTDTAPAPDAAQPGSDRSGSGSWGSSWDGGWTGGSAGGAGGGWGAGSGWDGSQPPPAPVPPQPGPGSRATSLVLAVALLTAAGIALAHQQGVLDANPWLVGGGAVLAVLGAGVLVSGMRGRTQGGIGVLALLLAIVVVPAAAAAAALPGFARIGTDATTWAGDPTWAPRTAADAESGYSLVAGQLVVDLSQLEEDADVTVPTSVTFGNLYVIVPDGADVTVNASVGAGEIVGPLDDDWSGPGMPVWGATRTDGSLTNGVGISATLVQEGDGSGPQITVDAEVSFGQLHIEETS